MTSDPERPLRIVHVVANIGWLGGVQEYVAGLSAGLRDLGHDVVILSGGDGPPAGPAAHSLADGVNVVWHPRRRILRRYIVAKGLWRSMREYARWADVVHVHQAGFSGSWLAMLLRVPTAGTLYLHPEDLQTAGLRRRLRLKLFARSLDLLVTVSVAERTLASAVRSTGRVCTVWPGVNRRILVPPSARRRRVVSVSRLVVAKGLEPFLRAAARLPKDVEVVVVGSGPDGERLRSVATEVGLSESVFVGGDLDDEAVACLLDESAVFVSASQQESFGISTFKAIRSGARPLVTDIPSHREIMTGVGLGDESLFDADISPAALARRILQALDMPPIPLSVANGGPEWKDSAAQLQECYRAIAPRRQ